MRDTSFLSPHAVSAVRGTAAARGAIEYRAWSISLISTAIRPAIFLSLAWLAAFRLKNWARWALAILFVAMQAIPLILSARVGRAQDFIRGEYLAPEPVSTSPISGR